MGWTSNVIATHRLPLPAGTLATRTGQRRRRRLQQTLRARAAQGFQARRPSGAPLLLLHTIAPANCEEVKAPDPPACTTDGFFHASCLIKTNLKL
jgi:hypothetical protein